MFDEQLKDRIMIALAILTAMCLVLAIGSSISAQKNKRNFQKEMVLLMDAEEKLAGLAPQAESLEIQLKNTQANLEGAMKELEDAKIINQELRLELEKTTKLKQVIEKDLKEALIRCRQ